MKYLSMVLTSTLRVLIAGLTVLGISAIATSSVMAEDTTYANNDWRVTVGSERPWSGVNGTGSFTYYGCDRDGKCIFLRNGKASCQFGICRTVWVNGEYSYELRSKIGEDSENQGTTLIVGNKTGVILRSERLRIVN
ncbi:hypothetical protein TUMEXPCC7403_02245 [Tumidithrix helvetica PCC 7403]|uniref:hypothetical protein n=1 Tax=Tumidithrix helvetica TaxID=3457545 RepID=UPI003CB4C880